MPGPRRHAARQLAKPIRILRAEDFFFADVEARQFGLRQINPAAVSVRTHITEDVRQLKGFAEIDSVIAARGILIAEDFDAQQADNGRYAVAVKFELIVVLVAADLEVHLAAPDKLVEERKRQAELADDRREFAVNRKFGIRIVAGT